MSPISNDPSRGKTGKFDAGRPKTGQAEVGRPKTGRRDFLKAGTVAGLSFGLAGATSPSVPPTPRAKAVIQLSLVGGPSQLETWDPKPHARSEVRGPFAAIQTRIPGVLFSELFPRMAVAADQFAVLRTLSHDEAPRHDTGHQLLQTGTIAREGTTLPHFGELATRTHAGTAPMTPWVVLAGSTSPSCDSLSRTDAATRLAPSTPTSVDGSRYGATAFGKACASAPGLIERGARVVTIDMFPGIFQQISWDVHANGRRFPTTFDHYRDQVSPAFDWAFTALLEDLTARGMIDDVLVVAMGECGRTPRLNNQGGRDHWTGAWSILMAGGGVRGGQVLGTTDDSASYPIDRPVHPTEVNATIRSFLGISSSDESPSAARPLGELFA
ncbi:hypothetical protein Pan216_18060 [Planctomycetes bacterium Pan216]|uniref:DUF1501 domain-containing protein n=1 Tax=Kolteria novifilia TaxID=2527975 RepID=A0A518B1U2_9BACT|nr:hypothetical protein Pan216_18060 [Planctomycetes bacterium Pan216]